MRRTVKVIKKADQVSPKSAPETWAALVTTLAELGKSKEARELAKQMEADANAPAEKVTRQKTAAEAARAKAEKAATLVPFGRLCRSKCHFLGVPAPRFVRAGTFSVVVAA